jgi:hypothetical protein
VPTLSYTWWRRYTSHPLLLYYSYKYAQVHAQLCNFHSYAAARETLLAYTPTEALTVKEYCYNAAYSACCCRMSYYSILLLQVSILLFFIFVVVVIIVIS